MSRVETVVWKKCVCVCWFSVWFGGNVASMEVNSNIRKVDWRGGDIRSENDVTVLIVDAVDEIV